MVIASSYIQREFYKVVDRRVYVPPTFGRPVENAADALESAACLLEEEGRSRKGDWYSHDDLAQRKETDDPYCNGWGSCAEGALMIVTGGMVKCALSDEAMAADVASYRTYLDANDTLWEVDFNSADLGIIAARDQKAVDIYDDAYKALLAEIRRQYPLRHFDRVYSFNDATDTTREDIVRVMRDASKRVRVPA